MTQADQSKGAFRAPATQTLAIYQAPDGTKRTPTLYIFSHVHNPAAPPSTSNHVLSSKPGLILTAVAPPFSCAPAVAPPFSEQNTVAPPLSGAPAVSPPLSDPTAVAPPLSGETAVSPPLSDLTAVAPPLTGETAVAPPLSGLPTVAQPISVSPPLSDQNSIAQPLSVPPALAPPPAVAPPPTVAPPLSQTETVLPVSALPPGQQVVLQPVAGMMGVNMCQFNGQTIQLVPVPSALPVTSTGQCHNTLDCCTTLRICVFKVDV